MALLELVDSKIDNNENTHFYWPRDLTEQVTLVLGGEYRYRTMPDDPPIRRVLDVGAGVGDFAAWAFRQWKKPWIDSYEPDPDVADIYEKNLAPGARLHRVAVSDVAGGAVLLRGADCTQGSLVAGATALSGEETSVDVISASSLPPADVLKISANGLEQRILYAYPHLTAAKIVMFRWHSAVDRMALEALCAGAGLSLTTSTHHHANLGLQVWVRTAAKFNSTKNIYEVTP